MKVSNFSIHDSKIATYKVTGVRMVSVSVLVKVGAWYENENEHGLFHLLEHLMMTGTEKFPSFRDISEYKERYGISCNAYTSRSKMEFWFQFPDIYLGEAFELIREIIFKSKVNFDNFENETKIIKQEYLDAWDDPYRTVDQKFERQLYGKDCNLTNDILGEPKIFMTAKRESLRKLYEKFFYPQRMYWGISGNFREKELREVLMKTIPKIKGEKFDLEVKNWSPKFGKLIIKEKRLKQASGKIIWQFNKIKKGDLINAFSLNMMNYLLGATSNSELFYKIRQQKGLVYRIWSSFWTGEKASYWEINFSCEENNLDRVKEESLLVMKQILTDKISKNKFQQVKNYLNLGTLMSFDSPRKISSKLVTDLFYEGKALSPIEINRLANKINLNKYQKYIKDQIKNEKRLDVLVIPELDQSSKGNNNGKKSQE